MEHETMTTIQLTNDVYLTVTRLSNTQLLGVWDTGADGATEG